MAERASPLFQCVRSEAPPMLSSACSIFTPRAPASWAIRPGRSLRAVKLLPTKSRRLGRLDDLLIELSRADPQNLSFCRDDYKMNRRIDCKRQEQQQPVTGCEVCLREQLDEPKCPYLSSD